MAAISARVFARSLLFPRINSIHLRRSPSSRLLTTEAKEQESSAESKSNDKAESEVKLSPAEKQLQEEKDKLLKQLDELTDKYKRALAETENVRRRNAKQLEDNRHYAIQGFCKDLIEVADVLTKATESVPKMN